MEEKNPLVTIICLCYNHASFVSKALDSVIHQSYKNIELLIADDASQDDSVEVIKKWITKYPQVFFIANKTNLGNTKTFNNLFKQAKGKYIIDLAADDVLTLDCVKKQVETFSNTTYKNLALVYGNLEIIDEKDNHLGYYYPVNTYKKVIKQPPSGFIYISLLAGEEKMCSVSSMIKSDILKSLGGYDESLAYEDFDIWIRASKKFDFEFIDEILVQKRELNNSMYQYFFKKHNTFSKRLNNSTYKILIKAFKQNTTKKENTAMLKRVHYEIVLNFKNGNYFLCFQLLILKLKIHLKFLPQIRH
ncbi:MULTISPECIES: glycosyltransferase [Flavobacterium]|uniref:Glycosyltransferase n=2 Tax=Flavobacterium TaxID=237 RepID=A0A246GKR6_9FLAO|nr:MULTISPECIES: glycosyltransferase [Flavobacterium]OWP84897.1 glycosyltransferase [Flavobacterium davisii]SPE78516.1 Putative glycosyltransferase EpsE [Flavobacterium columnare]